MVEVGEAFSGAQATALREALAAQSGRFFKAFHSTNLQVSGQLPASTRSAGLTVRCRCLLQAACPAQAAHAAHCTLVSDQAQPACVALRCELLHKVMGSLPATATSCTAGSHTASDLATVQALHMMLDKELWQRLPLEESAQTPSLRRALEGSREPAGKARVQPEGGFEAWLAQGNPWARQTTGVAGNFLSVAELTTDLAV